jgi:membrane-bound serine protease (ClpP class)
MIGPIDPATAIYVHRSISIAEANHAQAVIVLMNTPGGLLDSTKSIIQDFYTSSVPIIVYVWPETARAASAGAIITLGANVAAMSPSTNIGAAHPVSVTGGQPDAVMAKKIENDTAAFVRGIAEKRHRPLKWADEVVRESASLTENEARKQGIIDIIANNQQDLLKKLDGRKVDMSSGPVTIRSADAEIEQIEPTLRERFLHAIDDPNITYILMALAIYGLIFELSNPGAILPGVVGGICLILSLFSMAVVPVNLTGIFLIVFAVALFLIDLHVPTHGILTVGGVISFAVGSLMLFETGSPGFQISVTLVISVALLTGAFFMFAVGSGIRAQKNKIITGVEGMIGEVVEAMTDIDPVGKVFTEGSWWTARTEGEPIKKGEKVRIVAMEKLALIVKKAQ